MEAIRNFFSDIGIGSFLTLGASIVAAGIGIGAAVKNTSNKREINNIKEQQEKQIPYKDIDEIKKEIKEIDKINDETETKREETSYSNRFEVFYKEQETKTNPKTIPDDSSISSSNISI